MFKKVLTGGVLMNRKLINPNSISIIVNKGRFTTIQEAANAESYIDWWNDKDRDAIACTECFAALELRKHLCILTGANENDENNFKLYDDSNLPEGDNIVLGNCDTNKITAKLWMEHSIDDESRFEGLSPEGYYVKSVKQGENKILILSGKSRVGTLYAVYSFLEKLGFRWFGLGEKGMCYPKHTEVILPEVDYYDNPSFKTRGCYSEIIDDSNKEFIEWLTRNRVNFAFFDEITNPYNLKKRGIQICTGGHNILSKFLSTSKYFEAHPEWFGLVNGKRSSNVGTGAVEGAGDNYCTTNEEATAELCNNIVEALISGSLSKTDYLNLWMLDNGKWCSCDVCNAAGNYSYKFSMIVYKLSKTISQARSEGRLNRNIKILYNAYHETLPIPDRDLPEDFDYENCIITYFPIERCYLHRIDDVNCTETNQELMETYSSWTTNPERTYKGEIFLGEYYNVSAFASCPIPNMKMMKYDIPFYYSTGVRHMYYMHMTSTKWGTMTLTNYQFQKMLWNPHIDVDKLLDEYYEMYYGKISEQMKEFYEVLEAATRNMKFFKHYQYHKGVRHSIAHKLNADTSEIFPLKHMQYDKVLNDPNAGLSVTQTVELFKKCRTLIDSAMMTCTEEDVTNRLLEDEMRFTYGENMVYFLYYMIRTNIFKWRKQHSMAKRAFARARFYAEELEITTEPLLELRRFANMKNGLKATWCRDAYLNYLKIYG